MTRTADERWMRLAIALARLGAGATHPNPRVGVVAVRQGRVVGIGAHLRCGGPHAEAMLVAGASPGTLVGATLYINLEPCAHHGRTPPCAPALAPAGIFRVVAAMTDPDPRVSGRGLDCLRGAGIRVETGLCAARARLLNAPFLSLQRRNRPWVTLKVATSLDGRVAAADGSSRWISGPQARERVHRWRAECDAVLIGRGTLLRDLPRLSARPRVDPLRVLRRRVPECAGWPHQPVRMVADTLCRTAADEKLLDHMARQPGGPWIIVCGEQAPSGHVVRLQERGIRCWAIPEEVEGGRIDPTALLRRCAEEGLLDLLVEGGPALASQLLRRGLVDRLRIFQTPALLGAGPSWTSDLGIETLGERMVLKRLRSRRIGRDILTDALSREGAALLADAG